MKRLDFRNHSPNTAKFGTSQERHYGHCCCPRKGSISARIPREKTIDKLETARKNLDVWARVCTANIQHMFHMLACFNCAILQSNVFLLCSCGWWWVFGTLLDRSLCVVVSSLHGKGQRHGRGHKVTFTETERWGYQVLRFEHFTLMLSQWLLEPSLEIGLNAR